MAAASLAAAPKVKQRKRKLDTPRAEEDDSKSKRPSLAAASASTSVASPVSTYPQPPNLETIRKIFDESLLKRVLRDSSRVVLAINNQIELLAVMGVPDYKCPVGNLDLTESDIAYLAAHHELRPWIEAYFADYHVRFEDGYITPDTVIRIVIREIPSWSQYWQDKYDGTNS